MIKEQIKSEEGVIKVSEMQTITTVVPCKTGVKVSTQSKPTGKKINDDFIITTSTARDAPFWSEEEDGRWSGGALYEKTFKTRKEGEQYIADHKLLNGMVISHSTHWTGKSKIVYDSGKPAGTNISKN